MSHKFYLPAVLIALFGLAACASNPSTSSTAAAANSRTAASQSDAQAMQDPNRTVCRYERPVGTHFTKKVCRPAWQWAEAEKAAREKMRNMQNGENSRNCGSCGGEN